MSTSEEKSKKGKSENFKNAMCYVPFGAIVMFLAESKKTDTLRKNIKYGFILFLAYIILNFFLGWLMWGILFLVYAGLSIFFGLKAYNGEKVEIEYIDKWEKDFKDKM